MIRTRTLLIALLLATGYPVSAGTLHVGPGQGYASLESAAQGALPGDTILFHGGVYSGGEYVFGLQGETDAWIWILAAPGDSVIIRGGATAWQLSDPAYVHIEGFVFEGQTANGVNIDDGGDYSTPAHDLRITGCTFRDMEASGNNDLLKLSGLDLFQIRGCVFRNGSEGGSGIDMVGCHRGTIEENKFEHMGSNSIQAKGGTEQITIARNFFSDGGSRTLNLGGSTGLQYFRPIDAPFEAAHLSVHANLFLGSDAPIAYVGCVNVEVVNNTIFKPETWVVRILQETVDAARFLECGDNTFRNNIVYLGDIRTETNVGPNTRPESFTYADNLWYNYQDSSWSGPSIPVADPTMILGSDPLFADTLSRDFRLLAGSPAIGRVNTPGPPTIDYGGIPYNTPRSIGAHEGNPGTASVDGSGTYNPAGFVLHQNYPNPFNPSTTIRYELPLRTRVHMEVFDMLGTLVAVLVDGVQETGGHVLRFEAGELPSGLYLVRMRAGAFRSSRRMLLIR
jgi:hypothetical protein